MERHSSSSMAVCADSEMSLSPQLSRWPAMKMSTHREDSDVTCGRTAPRTSSRRLSGSTLLNRRRRIPSSLFFASGNPKKKAPAGAEGRLRRDPPDTRLRGLRVDQAAW